MIKRVPAGYYVVRYFLSCFFKPASYNYSLKIHLILTGLKNKTYCDVVEAYHGETGAIREASACLISHQAWVYISEAISVLYRSKHVVICVCDEYIHITVFIHHTYNTVLAENKKITVIVQSSCVNVSLWCTLWCVCFLTFHYNLNLSL